MVVPLNHKLRNDQKSEKKIVKYADLIENEIYNIKNSNKFSVLKSHTSSVTSVVISQEGKYLVSGSLDLTIKVWNLENKKKEEFTLAGHSDSVNSVVISQDGKYVISGSSDKTIKVWNLEEKKEEFTLQGHTSEITSVAITQDGKYLVSGSHDKTINVWNFE